MTRTRRQIFRGIILLLLLITTGTTEERRLFILHTNDIHGHIEAYDHGGLERIAAAVKLFRAAFGDEVVLLDGGDTSLGTPLSGTFHGKPTAEIMASMKYDAITLGNHEFNWGKENMRRLTTGMKTPVLCANLVTTDGSDPPYPPYTIVEKSGVKLAVIGMVTPDTYRRAPVEATQGWEFLSPSVAFKSTYPTLPDVDLVIALTHLGVDADKILLEASPEIDLVVGGHSHTPLQEIVYHSKRPIVQAGCYGQYLGVLEILVDTEANSAQVESYRLLEFDSSSPLDPRAHEIVEQYATELRPILAQVVATVPETLSKLPEANSFDTPLGNFISDVFREQAQTDIALYNRGGVRFDMASGPLTVEDVHKLFPFDDPVTVLRGTGRQIWDIIEQGTVDGEGPLSSSGLEAKFKNGKLYRVWVNGKSIQSRQMYTLATTGFLAGGGDGMTAIRQLQVIRKLPYTRDVLLNYLKTHNTVTSPGVGRLPKDPT